MTALSIAQLNPIIGAEIHGVDLSQPLAADVKKEIDQAWLAHQVVFFREQDLTLDEHKEFARQFGELHVHPNVPGHPDHEEVLIIHADEKSRYVAGQGWHSDVSCEPTPPKGSILRLTRVPESGGGDTLFASMYAAYEALSDHWQQFLSGLSAVHESAHVHGREVSQENTRLGEFARAEHPVVRTHPQTGRKALYVNSGFTTRIRGMRANESRATLGFLFRHMEHPDFQCRFSWEANSIAMWDNRCTQHYALVDYAARRTMHRVTVCGDRPT
jgi:taurine dioxygenase